MATDTRASFGTHRKFDITRVPPGVYGVLGVLVVGAVLWSLAPESGSRGETFARLAE